MMTRENGPSPRKVSRRANSCCTGSDLPTKIMRPGSGRATPHAWARRAYFGLDEVVDLVDIPNDDDAAWSIVPPDCWEIRNCSQGRHGEELSAVLVRAAIDTVEMTRAKARAGDCIFERRQLQPAQLLNHGSLRSRDHQKSAPVCCESLCW